MARRHCIFVVEEVPITTTATINTVLIRRQSLIYHHSRSAAATFSRLILQDLLYIEAVIKAC